jgi:hypothetical protein
LNLLSLENTKTWPNGGLSKVRSYFCNDIPVSNFTITVLPLYLYYQLHSLGQLTQRVMSGVVITLHPSAAGVSSKLFLFLFSLSRFAS